MTKLLGFALFLTFTAIGAEPTKIFKSTIGEQTFYHIKFTLTSSNSTFVVAPDYQNSQWRSETNSVFRNDGMFEVFIRAEQFPIPAPHCNGGWIILRMPSTQESGEEAELKIAAKKALWENLKQIYTTKSGGLEVVIDLNPYIRVLDPIEPKLELEYCNVFFRHAHDSYVSYVGPLKAVPEVPPIK